MFIDIHAHAYRRPVPFVVQFPSVEQLIRRFNEEEIEKGVVLPIVSPEVYIPQTNEEVLDMAEQYPDRIVPFCNVDPRALTNSADAPLDRVLRYYRDKGCKGLGEVMANLPLMHPLVQNLFRHAQDVGFPVIFDGSDRIGGDFGLYDEPGLPQLEHTLLRFPDLIMLGHGPVFWSEIAPLDRPALRSGGVFRTDGEFVTEMPSGPIKEEGVVPQLLRRFGNLYGDLSDCNPHNALTRDMDYGPKFVTEFQDRLLFGSDICTADFVFDMAHTLRQWRDEKLITQEVFNKVARENAIKLLKL